MFNKQSLATTKNVGHQRIDSAIAFDCVSPCGQALRQVVDLPLGIPAEPLVEGDELLKGNVRVVVRVVVHAFQWTRSLPRGAGE